MPVTLSKRWAERPSWGLGPSRGLPLAESLALPGDGPRLQLLASAWALVEWEPKETATCCPGVGIGWLSLSWGS